MKLENDCERLSKTLGELECFASQREREFDIQKSKSNTFSSERQVLFNKIEELNAQLSKANEDKNHLIKDIENLTKDNHKWSQESQRARIELEETVRNLGKTKSALEGR